MAPIQSRRSRKLRETAYVNGQHNNVLKEITTTSRDGTVPLMNFLENTERFIADTNILYSRVNQLEREQVNMGTMGNKMNEMIAFLKQMTGLLNTLLPEHLDFDLTQEDFSVNEIAHIEPANYFKPNEAKRLERPFPSFSNDHAIKINIGPDVVLTDIETPEIHILASGRAKKGTIEMATREEIMEESTTDDIQTLGYNGPRKNRLELPVTAPKIVGKTMENNNAGLLKKYDGFRTGTSAGLYEIDRVDEQLTKDSEKVEQLLRKLKRHSHSATMNFATPIPNETSHGMQYELEDDDDDDDTNTYTVTNIRDELLSKRRSRRNYQGLPLTKPAMIEQDVVKLVTTTSKTPDAIAKTRRRGTQRILDHSTGETETLVIHEKESDIQKSHTLRRLKQKRVSNPPLDVSKPSKKDNDIRLKTKQSPSVSLLGRNKARSMKLRELQKHNAEMNSILDEEMRELDQIRAMLLEDDD